MAYHQYNDQYRQLVLSGRLPYPYAYQNVSSVPNLVGGRGECFRNRLFGLPFYEPHCEYPIEANNGLALGPVTWNPNCGESISCDICPDYQSYYNKIDPINNIRACGEQPFCSIYSVTPQQDPSVNLNFRLNSLVSSIPLDARFLDGNIVDPWGLILERDTIWVANAGSGLITQYHLSGRPLRRVINVFGPLNNVSSPTGIVINPNSQAFLLRSGSNTQPANIIVATRDGTINAYSENIDFYNSIIIVNNSANNSVYTGLALANNTLYAADFYNQKIDVFNSEFLQINTVAYPFIDQFSSNPIPSDYAPYNIALIDSNLYVTYAKHSPTNSQFEDIGTGYGYVSIFDLQGQFIRRFVSNGVLNAPWGISLAPNEYGYPPGTIIIGNFGDGIFNVFEANGRFFGKITDASGVDLCVEGLRG